MLLDELSRQDATDRTSPGRVGTDSGGKVTRKFFFKMAPYNTPPSIGITAFNLENRRL